MGWKLGRRTEKPVEKVQPSESSDPAVVNGFFRGGDRLVSGWILDLQDFRRKHDVEVFVGGKLIGKARGDRFDPVVQAHHGGDGRFAFALYYDGELDEGSAEASVVDAESGTALRSKQPLVTGGTRSGPPLTIEQIRVGSKVELSGQIGAYAVGGDLALEFWSDNQRVMSSIPLTIIDDDDGRFSAVLEGEALQLLIAGNIKVALPGLMEAGLAIPIAGRPLGALVLKQDHDLSLRLTGEFEQSGPIAVTVRLKGSGADIVENKVVIQSKAVVLTPPAGFHLSEGSIEVLIGGVALPTKLGWSSLRDLQFRSLGEEKPEWRVSENSTVERGFFAFPATLADGHQLSGNVAHVSGEPSGKPLRLSQEIAETPSRDVGISIGAFVRSAKSAKLALRLRDDEGVLCESTTTGSSPHAWSLLVIDQMLDREVSGTLVFEAEAAGRKIAGFDIAFANSSEAVAQSAQQNRSNVVANGDFQQWPNGAGVREHSVRGELCAGWGAFNRKTTDPIFSKAVMHPSDGSLGLGVAAPTVKHYLRLEVDLEGAVTERPLTLRFRAGVTAAARQMLAQQADAVPQFAVIDRVHLIRRLMITTNSGFEQRDDVAAVFERKIPIGADVERFEYSLPPLDEQELPSGDKDAKVVESYHLAFDFRHPTVVALFDVELLADDDAESSGSAPRLELEDRNIAMQIATLETVQHWRGATPVRLAAAEPGKDPSELKWSVGVSREPVEIVIPVFNALPETLACLDSLGRSTTVPILVRLVDDRSDPPVYDALRHYALGKPWIQVQRFAENRGYTYAADHGIRSARTDWVVLLNSDTIVTRGWLEGMLQCSRSDPAIAFVGPLSNAASYQSVPELYDSSRKWKVNRLPPGMSPDDMAEIVRRSSVKGYPDVPLLNGFCTLMKRNAFIELGGLNPAAFPAGYGEENDLCLRASKAGFKLAVADDVYVYHVKSASFGSARREELTRGGNAALKKLHPDVDIGALTARFRETPELVALRQAVAAELSKAWTPPHVEIESDAPAKSGEQSVAEPRSKTSDPEGLTCA